MSPAELSTDASPPQERSQSQGPSLSLEQRIRVLEDVENIRRLKARYCQACDDNHNPDTLQSLFTPDAVWEASGVRRCEGHDEIRNFFQELADSGFMRNSAHNAINPDIEVTGDTATGHWRLIMLFTANLPGGDIEHQRIIGWYRERYVRTSSGWKFAHLYCQVEEQGTYLTNAHTKRPDHHGGDL